MFSLANDWIWDFWLADDGDHYHMYFLKAPKSLLDPDLRHWNVRVGRAVSSDLHEWREVGDALRRSDAAGFDDKTTWTGSVVRDDGGTWHMFYTGTSARENGLKQRIGVATSADLALWEKQPQIVLETDGRWYERYPNVEWQDEAWRDPWVFRDPDDHGWHMLITARANAGGADERGVIGHARSSDLTKWEVGPPLSAPESGFGHLEVPQVEVIEGRAVLIFSCLGAQLGARLRNSGITGGIWAAPIDDIAGPYDVTGATQLTDESLYSGRVIQDRRGEWVLLAFRNTDETGAFVGEITDPISVGWSSGRLTAETVVRPSADPLAVVEGETQP